MLLPRSTITELLESSRALREEGRLRRESMRNELAILRKHVEGVLEIGEVKKQEEKAAAQT